MSNPLSYLRQLVGNGKAATIGIFIFIAILLFFFYRPAKGAEVDVRAGSSFGAQGTGPVLGLGIKSSIQPGLNVIAGTDLWGSTTYRGSIVPSNWSWNAGIQGCKWKICADIGPAYVQRVDAINGAHTNFHLGISLQLSSRCSIILGHISDAGTTDPNVGRQALTFSYKLQ